MTSHSTRDDRSSPTRRAAVLTRLLATLPPLATTIAFALAWQRWGSDYATVMAKTIQLEFLVIHAGLFLGVFIMVPVSSVLFRILRWVAVALLAYLYLHAGHSLLGWHGAFTIVAIFVGTYGGFLLAPTALVDGESQRGRRATEIGVRWFLSMLAYGLISKAFALPELVNTWTDLRDSVAMGTLYFAALALVEATPLYARLRGATAPSPRAR